MNFSNPTDYIENQLKLLLLEKEEERKEYERRRNLNKGAKKKQGILWHPVHIEREEYPLRGKILLLISKSEDNYPVNFQTGETISLFHSEQEETKYSIRGVISKIQKNSMEVLFSLEELPDWVDEYELSLESYYQETSYNEMERALNILLKPEKDRTLELRNILTNFKKPGFNTSPNIKIPNLNESQNRAVNHLLSAEHFGIIHGPPGTGKTHTLIELARELCKTESTVLLTASSNVAVDLLVEKAISAGLTATRIGNPARVNERIIPYTLEYKLNDHNEYKSVIKYKREADELFRKAGKFKRNFGKKEREERKELKKEARDLIKTAVEYETNLSLSILEKSDIIGSTLIGITYPIMQKMKFQSIIVDEATQCLEPGLWIAILKTENRIFFAGDHKQLPPTIHSKDNELSTTLFEKLNSYYIDTNVSNLLNTQYRMKENILGFSNKWFYEERLKTDSSVYQRNPVDIFNFVSEGKNISFIDTAGSDTEEKLDEESMSYYNETEISLIKNLIDTIKQNHLQNIIKMGILSPYRSQVEKLKEEFSGFNKENFELEINTIDSFQGSERDIILISLVRSNDNGEVGFLEDEKRLNVALTRAREELILIGDSSTLSFNHFYNSLMDFVSQSGSYRTIWEFM
ncbi:MAG: AAA family ATPase [Leptospiraceae bacterium]|nr:AAA family ATPase [Leptospiraceae bacterium]